MMKVTGSNRAHSSFLIPSSSLASSKWVSSVKQGVQCDDKNRRDRNMRQRQLRFVSHLLLENPLEELTIQGIIIASAHPQWGCFTKSLLVPDVSVRRWPLGKGTWGPGFFTGCSPAFVSNIGCLFVCLFAAMCI